MQTAVPKCREQYPSIESCAQVWRAVPECGEQCLSGKHYPKQSKSDVPEQRAILEHRAIPKQSISNGSKQGKLSPEKHEAKVPESWRLGTLTEAS